MLALLILALPSLAMFADLWIVEKEALAADLKAVEFSSGEAALAADWEWARPSLRSRFRIPKRLIPSSWCAPIRPRATDW